MKRFLAYELKMVSYSNRVEFYDDNDFEVVFQAFDIFNKDEISLEKLWGIFAVFRIPCDPQLMITRHKLTPGQPINKKTFLKVIKREYSKMVSLDTNPA